MLFHDLIMTDNDLLHTKSKEIVKIFDEAVNNEKNIFSLMNNLHGITDGTSGRMPDFLEERKQTIRPRMKHNLLEYFFQESNFGLLSILTFLGANWEANNGAGETMFEKVSKKLQNDEPNSFNKRNNFLKWWTLKSTDQHWLKFFRIAAEKGFENCLTILIENKSDVNVWSTEDGNTALHFATFYKLQEAAQRLTSKNADVNAKNFDGKAPLHVAIENGNIGYMHLLIEKKADTSVKNFVENTPLHLAAKFGRIDFLKLLSEQNADVNAKNRKGNTPLHVAASRGHTDCLKLLIEKNADVNAKNCAGETSIHFAAQQCQFDCLNLLIEKGANVNVDNLFKQKPLHLLFYYAHESSEKCAECAKALIDADAEINAKGKNNTTPLHGAAKSQLQEKEKEKCCKLLIQAGADLSAQDGEGKTPLDYNMNVRSGCRPRSSS
jgi:ankyrin repeat protein